MRNGGPVLFPPQPDTSDVQPIHDRDAIANELRSLFAAGHAMDARAFRLRADVLLMLSKFQQQPNLTEDAMLAQLAALLDRRRPRRTRPPA